MTRTSVCSHVAQLILRFFPPVPYCLPVPLPPPCDPSSFLDPGDKGCWHLLSLCLEHCPLGSPWSWLGILLRDFIQSPTVPIPCCLCLWGVSTQIDSCVTFSRNWHPISPLSPWCLSAASRLVLRGGCSDSRPGSTPWRTVMYDDKCHVSVSHYHASCTSPTPRAFMNIVQLIH